MWMCEMDYRRAARVRVSARLGETDKPDGDAHRAVDGMHILYRLCISKAYTLNDNEKCIHLLTNYNVNVQSSG